MAGSQACVACDLPPLAGSVERLQQPVSPGILALREEVLGRFPGVTAGWVEGFAQSSEALAQVRRRGPSARIDEHHAGRAVDLVVPLAGATPDLDAGNAVADWLVIHAEEIGVQRIVWAGTVYSSGPAGGRFVEWTGEPHDDRIHVAITEQAGRMQTSHWSRRRQMLERAPQVALAIGGIALAGAGLVWLWRHRRKW